MVFWKAMSRGGCTKVKGNKSNKVEVRSKYGDKGVEKGVVRLRNELGKSMFKGEGGKRDEWG